MNDALEKLRAMQSGMTPMTGPSPMPMQQTPAPAPTTQQPTPWSQPAATMNGGGAAAPPYQQAPGMPVGLLIPVEFETPIGTVSCYMQFQPSGPDVQAQFMALLEMLAGQGWKLRAWQRKQQGWGNQGGQGGGGWGGGGGFNRGGGGWRR